jgi:hypothetical protein
VGAGVYLIHWRVASTQSLVTADGSFAPSGTSTWTRTGLGLLAGYRWNRHLGSEVRFQSSHMGYENQPARVWLLEVLWHL